MLKYGQDSGETLRQGEKHSVAPHGKEVPTKNVYKKSLSDLGLKGDLGEEAKRYANEIELRAKRKLGKMLTRAQQSGETLRSGESKVEVTYGAYCSKQEQYKKVLVRLA
jgi:hypothetical protein